MRYYDTIQNNGTEEIGFNQEVYVDNLTTRNMTMAGIYNFFEHVQALVEHNACKPENMDYYIPCALMEDWYPHWILKKHNISWYIRMLDQGIELSQVNGVSSVGFNRIPYNMLNSVQADLHLDGSRLVGLWFNFCNGFQVRVF